MRFPRVAVLVLACCLIFLAEGEALAERPPQTTALKIIVIEGEDAVNVLQQRTAVAPVVEVRDRNDQPVAGALVRFTVKSGRATFNGARALTVTTNAAGRAVATGLTPTGTGALHIAASASFNGQTAAIAIAQTNVATAASAGAGAAAGAAVGGATAGGGISAATIGVIGASAVGGTLAATKLAGGDGSSNNSNPKAPSDSTRTFTGPLVFTLTTTGRTVPAGVVFCSMVEAINGTLTIVLDQHGTSFTGQGTATFSGTKTVTSNS